MAAHRLDQIDLRILNALQENGRLSNVDLAGRVGLSASACLRRVQGLEQEGYITGYSAYLDAKRLGLGITAFVQVQVAQDNESATQEFRERIGAMAEVVECYAVTGSFDYLLKVMAADMERFEQFAMKRLLKTPGVRDVRTCFVLDTMKAASVLPITEQGGDP
ncbi:MAG: Lrp/AsnC family transcriptional regulator [Alphaproteobacteria bacterium]